MYENTPPEHNNPPRKSRRRRSWMSWVTLFCAVAALCIAVFALYLAWPKAEPEPAPEPIYIQYRDMHLLPKEGVAINEYAYEAFQWDENGWMTYTTQDLTAIPGIDVSFYQKEIDWNAVAQSGIQFAMIRAGYRGYTEGGLQADSLFSTNIQGALDAGIQVGVYFFSQAITPEEAKEEAQYLLDAIKDYDVTWPLVFDWEFVTPEEARTALMDNDTLTQCALAFCQTVAAAGRTPMIYSNQDLAYLHYDLSQLVDYPLWLAEYNERPGFYYHFDMLQYTHKGTIPGIEGSVDLNLAFRDFSTATP